MLGINSVEGTTPRVNSWDVCLVELGERKRLNLLTWCLVPVRPSTRTTPTSWWLYLQFVRRLHRFHLNSKTLPNSRKVFGFGSLIFLPLRLKTRSSCCELFLSSPEEGGHWRVWFSSHCSFSWWWRHFHNKGVEKVELLPSLCLLPLGTHCIWPVSR